MLGKMIDMIKGFFTSSDEVKIYGNTYKISDMRDFPYSISLEYSKSLEKDLELLNSEKDPYILVDGNKWTIQIIDLEYKQDGSKFEYLLIF